MRTRRVLLALALVALGSVPLACDAARAADDELVVFAAASLRDVAAELGAAFEATEDAEVVFNFAGSNVLAQQLAAAPRADVFLSADERWIDFLEREDRLVPGSRRPFLRNRLVVVGRSDARVAVEDANDLASARYRHLALADPEGVPAGRYARAWLEAVPYERGSVWEAVAPRVVPALDVRAALALVESDPEVIGLVYASDVHGSKRVRVLFEPAASEQPAIVYGAARVATERASFHAQRFFDFLFEREALAIYAAHGFVPPEPR